MSEQELKMPPGTVTEKKSLGIAAKKGLGFTLWFAGAAAAFAGIGDATQSQDPNIALDIGAVIVGLAVHYCGAWQVIVGEGIKFQALRDESRRNTR